MALLCEECFHTRFYKSNKKPFEGRRWWRCKKCGHVQLGYKPRIWQEPRELYVDIEIAPNKMEVLTYDMKNYEHYYNADDIIQDWFIICWSAEWMNCFNHKNSAMCVLPKDARVGDDSHILKPLRDLLDEADIVWGHNIKKFDRKKINTRLILNSIQPPYPYKMIDTLQFARSNFSFASNRLAYLTKKLGVEQKDKMEPEDWQACMRGEKKFLDKAQKYNIKDVKVGIAVVKKMREWIVPFPKIGGYVRIEM